MIFHGVHNLGEMISVPLNKVAVLSGLAPTASIVESDVESALKTADIITSTLNELEDCANREEVVDITAPAETSDVTFKDVATTKAFDEKHANINTSYPSKAADHCSKSLLCWAWRVRTGKINKTSYNIHPEDSEFQNYNAERHNQCTL
eukprot:9080834-Ditylum_brightwellii.AAC.1